MMVALLAILIIIFLFLFAYRITHSIIHPAVVTSAIWSILLICYNTIDHVLYPLSDKFYLALLLWVVPFCIMSLIWSRISSARPSFIGRSSNKKLVNFLLPLTFLSLFIVIFSLYRVGINENSDNVFNGIRAASIEALKEGTPMLPAYAGIFAQFAIPAVLIFFLIGFVEKRDNRILFVVFSLLLFTFTLIRMNKVAVAQLLLGVIFLLIYYKKLSLKKAGFIFLFFVALMIIPQLLRSSAEAGSFDLIRFLSIYMLAPLPAFDSVLTGNTDFIDSFHGEYTFRFIVSLLQNLGLDITGNRDPFNLDNWVQVPLPLNVYTVMFNFYVDFGMWGIFIFSSLLGSFWGWLYNKIKHGKSHYIIIYAALFYTLVFQFFMDYFFTFFINTLLVIIVTCILYIHIQLHPDSSSNCNRIKNN